MVTRSINDINHDNPDGLPTQTGKGGKFLVTDGTTASWHNVTQVTPVPMVANAGSFTVDDSAEYIVDITGALTGPGALTCTITDPTVPFTMFVDNMATGNTVTLNGTYDIPTDISIWYYDGSVFEQVFGVNTYVPVVRTVNGHALSSNVTLAKSDISLGNVDNTSDATKNAATVTLTNKTINNSANTIVIGANQDFSSFKITGLANGTVATDAVNKSQLDSITAGLSNKTQSGVTVATTAALAAFTYANGAAGVGATITINAVGTLTVDTHQVLLNEYVVVKNETAGNAPYNGYYKCTTEGTAGVAAVLTRDTGVDTASEFLNSYVFINTGTANINTGWNVNAAVTTVGTDAVNWTQFSASSGAPTAGTGITVVGNQVSINTAVVPVKTDNLSVFGATTSAQLAGVLSDETGSGAAVFGTSPTLTTPNFSGQAVTTTEGVYEKQGLDASHMYRFTGTTLTSGDLYTLLGELCMDGWSHNTYIDASGNFVARENVGTCELWVFTEAGLIKHYSAVTASAGVVPTWTLKYTFNVSTGAMILVGNLTTPTVNKVTITAPASAATLTIADGKTLTASNSITFAGTDSTVMTFPGVSSNVGYLEVPQNSQSAAYTTVLSDAGKHILHPSADTTARQFNIAANSSVAYPVGTAITFINQDSAGVLTITVNTDTMRLAGVGTTGNRTLAANGIATAVKVATTEWLISGVGLS